MSRREWQFHRDVAGLMDDGTIVLLRMFVEYQITRVPGGVTLRVAGDYSLKTLDCNEACLIDSERGRYSVTIGTDQVEFTVDPAEVSY